MLRGPPSAVPTTVTAPGCPIVRPSESSSSVPVLGACGLSLTEPSEACGCASGTGDVIKVFSSRSVFGARACTLRPLLRSVPEHPVTRKPPPAGKVPAVPVSPRQRSPGRHADCGHRRGGRRRGHGPYGQERRGSGCREAPGRRGLGVPAPPRGPREACRELDGAGRRRARALPLSLSDFNSEALFLGGVCSDDRADDSGGHGRSARGAHGQRAGDGGHAHLTGVIRPRPPDGRDAATPTHRCDAATPTIQAAGKASDFDKTHCHQAEVCFLNNLVR